MGSSDCESLNWCVLCLVQNTLYSKKCLKEQIHTCFLINSLTFAATHDATRAQQYGRCLELKHKTKKQQLRSVSDYLMYCTRPGLGCCRTRSSCCWTVNLEFVVLLSTLLLWWSPRISTFDDFLLLIWILLHYSSLLVRKQEDKPQQTNNTLARALKPNAKLKAQVK